MKPIPEHSVEPAPIVTHPEATLAVKTEDHDGVAHRRAPAISFQTAFGCPRDFLENRYVYAVISPRAHGLSIGVNFNPDKKCNFNCIYCEVDRTTPGADAKLDLDVVSEELHRTLNYVYAGGLAMHPRYAGLSPELLRPRHVTLSGDGEPTLCPQFLEIVQTIVHVRAMARVPFFKMILITNATYLDAPVVAEGLKLFTSHDEIWAKLEAGTQAYYNQVNAGDVPLEKILANILLIGRQRPIIIQSLFPMVKDQPPSNQEIEAYAQRLNDLKQAGARISLVQVYSATRPHDNPDCSHMPLRYLSQIAQTVRAVTGLKTEVY